MSVLSYSDVSALHQCVSGPHCEEQLEANVDRISKN